MLERIRVPTSFSKTHAGNTVRIADVSEVLLKFQFGNGSQASKSVLIRKYFIVCSSILQRQCSHYRSKSSWYARGCLDACNVRLNCLDEQLVKCCDYILVSDSTKILNMKICFKSYIPTCCVQMSHEVRSRTSTNKKSICKPALI